MNGPADELDWSAIEWRSHEENVERLRKRIFKATRGQNWTKVRSLQKMMLRSWSNTLISVRQVTQHNAGRRTSGVDGEVVLSASGRAETAMRVHRSRLDWDPKPVWRVHIPKANGKKRPLGIPVIMDRCHQARIKNALEPEWEARFEPRSYGFRPGRGCVDAIAVIFTALAPTKARKVWVLDADLSAAFDRINHSALLEKLGSFPGRKMIHAWLKSGIIEKGRFAPTEEGTPQGGVISPLLLNVALHGLEEAAGVRYRTYPSKGWQSDSRSPMVVRYADDLVVCCLSQEQAEQVKAQLAAWLKPRGLSFNEDKTHIVHLNEGFDFLGFNVRRHRSRKLIIRPSSEAVRRIRKRLTDEVRSLRGSNAMAVIARLNPIIRGWAAYYRGVVSSRIFSSLDNHVWKLMYKWARHSHPKKPKKWIARRYFGRFNKFRNDRWVFGARDHISGRGDVIHLAKFSWTKIVRHRLVAGGASPDDPDLAEYWAERRKKVKPALDGYNLRLLANQNGRCPVCRSPLLSVDQPPKSPYEWERWWLGIVRRAIRVDHLVHEGQSGGSDNHRTRLVHTSCQNGPRARMVREAASRPVTSSRLA